MAKRYHETVEVEAPDGQIEAFTWRGRRFAVRQVLGRWRETGEWWDSGSDRPWAGAQTAEILRVDAERSASVGGVVRRDGGTFELRHDLRSGAWSLHRVYD